MKKKDVLSIIDSLEKINNSITRNLATNIPVATEVLVDCQDSAIAVGNEIEKCGQKGEEIVHLLEAYCENIYQMSCLTTDFNGCRKLTKKIQKQLVQVRNMIKYDLPDDRKQIVFLPYKASMWDSLESVWMAADADPDCDAYVIPIPYYDKNPDGSLGEEHYEGDWFPDYVPITRYDVFDFEEQHPDIIYIHNPYDQYNFVTSVHPFFYSESLKKFTDKLVYIPYFICSSSIREENCLQKGVVTADVVILQSDKIRDDYIKAFQKELGNIVPKEKFMALGSPKFDKVIHSSAFENSLTAQWKKRADGRKIILYNTHLNTLLRYEEEAVRKIESVFHYFAQRDDVLLLWRPHPLSKATLKSMRPALYEAYAALEKEYLDKDIGILDESEDMYQAIGVADGYYGDGSSVLTVFGATGKPICIQNILITSYGYGEISYNFQKANIDGQGIYFANMYYNALLVLDRATGGIQCIGEFPESGKAQGSITDNIGIWKEKLWMIPHMESKVFSYDLRSGKWDVFELPKEWCAQDGFGKFMLGKQIDRYYYAFGHAQYGVLKLDMETGEMSYSRNNLQQYEQVTALKGGMICRRDCCHVDGKLYVASLRGNIVLAYDLQTEKIKIYQVGVRDRRYVTITYDGDVFWLADTEGKLVRWNHRTGATQEIDLRLDEKYNAVGRWPFDSSLYASGHVWLFAYLYHANIRFNIHTYEVEEIYEFKGLKGFSKVWASWYEEGKVCFVDNCKHSIIQIDNEGSIGELVLPVDEGIPPLMGDIQKQVWEVQDKVDYHSYIHYENGGLGRKLGGYLDFITMRDDPVDAKQQECFLRFTKYPEGNAGEMIHRKMIEEV